MVEHATLSGSQLHEPKGVSSAASGAVYIADGAGSGTWTVADTLNKVILTCRLTDVSTASSVYVVAPIAGTVSKIYSALQGPITVADSVVTASIGGVNLTNGSLTVAYSGSAAGDVDSCTPTANNTVTAGQAIKITTDGASTDTAALVLTIVIDT